MTATFGLGLAALGRPGYMTVGHSDDLPDATEPGMRRAAFETFDEAWRLGVRHFDAARSYGLAESFLADWLGARGHRDAVVSSKWGYRYTANWQRVAAVHEVKDHSLSHLESQLVESRALLGASLHVYQLHSLTPDSPALSDARLLDRLEQLRDEGLELGVSVSGARQAELIEKLSSIRRNGARLFGWVQATWNLLERSAGPALAAAHDAGLRVIIKEALANGRLSPRGDVAALLAEAARRGTTADALSLAIALAQPFADVVLSGAATPLQLRQNLSAHELAVRPDALAEVSVSAETYWRERATLKWT
ncbi:MAG: aldo/keto reductase [Myxococcales bacterium]|nr:aldo/keto reductase [Myxococcales bacterium]